MWCRGRLNQKNIVVLTKTHCHTKANVLLFANTIQKNQKSGDARFTYCVLGNLVSSSTAMYIVVKTRPMQKINIHLSQSQVELWHLWASHSKKMLITKLRLIIGFVLYSWWNIFKIKGYKLLPLSNLIDSQIQTFSRTTNWKNKDVVRQKKSKWWMGMIQLWLWNGSIIDPFI